MLISSSTQGQSMSTLMSADSRHQFLWGAATAAYQVEGATNVDGRGPSVWDEWSAIPGKMANGNSGDIACDQYHRWREDVRLMETLNLNAYRFSVSWSRVLPDGEGRVNQVGLDHYDRLVDGLCQNEIEPLVTLYHWDLPLALQRKYGGWLHEDIPRVFSEYARVLFERL